MNRQDAFRAITRRALRINYHSPGICMDIMSSSGSSSSVSFDFTPVRRKAGITALTVGSNASQVRLMWPELPGAFAYAVYRYPAPGAVGVVLIAGLRSFSYTDTPPTTGTTWYYRVSAIEPDFGETELSNLVSATL